MLRITREHQRLFSEYIPESYSQIMDRLNDMNRYESLPTGSGLTEEANQLYDQKRLEFIRLNIDTLINYHSEPGQLVPQVLSAKKELEAIALDNAKELILNISRQLVYLSKNMRDQFEELLSSSNFAWKKFEQLGSLMISHEDELICMYPADQSYNAAVYERAFNEYVESEKIAIAAIPTIIKDDMPELQKFVTHMTEYRLARDSGAAFSARIPAINLSASIILINRVCDLNNIIKLIRIANPELDDFSESTSTLIGNNRPRINLNTDEKRYAVLRRLEIAGELTVDNNFSDEIRLDQNVDWDLFKKLRHALVHQERYQNREKVDFIIDNPKILEGMLRELYSLTPICFNTLLLRDAAAQYTGDGENLWSQIYSRRAPQVTNTPLALHPVAQQSLATLMANITSPTKSNLNTFLTFLDRNNAAANIQRFWLDFSEQKLTSLDKDIIAQSKVFINEKRNSSLITTEDATWYERNIIKPVEVLLRGQHKIYQDSKNMIKEEIEREIATRQLNTPYIMAVNNLFYDGITSSNFRPDGKTPSLRENIEVIIKSCAGIQEALSRDTDPTKPSHALEYLVIKSVQLLDHIKDEVLLMERLSLRGITNTGIYGDTYELHIKFIRNYIAHGQEIFDTEVAESRSAGETVFDMQPNIRMAAIYILSQKDVLTKVMTKLLPSRPVAYDQSKFIDLRKSIYTQLPKLDGEIASNIRISCPTSYSDDQLKEAIFMIAPLRIERHADKTDIEIGFKDLVRISYIYNTKYPSLIPYTERVNASRNAQSQECIVM